MEVPNGSFQILSLDGGGIKGLFSAAVLAYLEEDLGITIIDHFDLITGTSTGGIIALGLALGMRPREIVDFYVSEGPRIFPKVWFPIVRRIRRRKYAQAPLKRALINVFGERTLGDCTKRVVIPAFDLNTNTPRLFKTPHHERLRRDWKIEAWKVALATTAAPTYFCACRDIEAGRFVDGGVWANNPTLVGIGEAMSLLEVPLDVIKVFSLGTFDEVVSRPDSLDEGGIWAWREAGADVLMVGQSQGVDNLATLLLGKDRLLRVSPNVPKGLFELDRVSTEKMISQAAHSSLHIAPAFNRLMKPHVAEAFEPCNSKSNNNWSKNSNANH